MVTNKWLQTRGYKPYFHFTRGFRNISNINHSSDKEALIFISKWIKEFIHYKNFPTDLVSENINKILYRTLEDKGLQNVSHGIVDKKNLKELIIKMNNEIRQIQ